MPRQPRLDIPGLLHPVIARGIERREISGDDRDRRGFVEKLGELVNASGAKVYAWCLLSNHFHIVLKSGDRPLAWFMRRLMTASHAVRYNLRHDRSGHLFQNRYQSIVVEEEEYLLELVRYLALNPIRAGMVRSPAELDRYPWSGHAGLVGQRSEPWQDVEEVLGRFAPTRKEAVRRYRAFVRGGWDQGRRDEWTGVGLIRSAGGTGEGMRPRPEEPETADERILGGGAFVEQVWRAAQERGTGKPQQSWEETLRETAAKFGLEETQILSRSRARRVSQARRQFFLRSRDEAGLSVTALGRICKFSPPSVSRGIQFADRSESESGRGTEE